MYNVSEYIDSVKSTTIKNLCNFYIDSIPRKPYCADDDYFIRILPKKQALTKKKIQDNTDYSISSFTIDIDYNDAIYHVLSSPIPAPNFLIENLNNSRAHIKYLLIHPVYKNNIEMQKAVKLLAHIQYTITDILSGDKSFSNLLSKNPFHTEHNLVFSHLEPYTLTELREALPALKSKPPRDELLNFGVGRNVSMFEYLRHKAYSYFTRNSKSFNVFSCFVYLCEIGKEQNYIANPQPLSDKELHQICKNISRWVDRNMDDKIFSDIQKHRGLKSGKTRKNIFIKRCADYQSIVINNPHLSNREIAKLCNVSEGTIRNIKKHFEAIKKDSPLFDVED